MMPFVPWPTPDDTPALLQALAAGERQALETLYRRLAPAVYRYALGLSGDACLAADATHDAFAALAERPRAFDPSLGTLGGWLAGVARHTLLARQRRRGARSTSTTTRWTRCRTTRRRRALPGAPAGPVATVGCAACAAVGLARGRGAGGSAGTPYAEAARIAGCELNTLRT